MKSITCCVGVYVALKPAKKHKSCLEIEVIRSELKMQKYNQVLCFCFPL